jgi:hypothetical protein
MEAPVVDLCGRVPRLLCNAGGAAPGALERERQPEPAQTKTPEEIE